MVLNKSKDILFLNTRNWGLQMEVVSLRMAWDIVRFRKLIPDHIRLFPSNIYLLNLCLFIVKHNTDMENCLKQMKAYHELFIKRCNHHPGKENNTLSANPEALPRAPFQLKPSFSPQM